jgi:hypothetical protein
MSSTLKILGIVTLLALIVTFGFIVSTLSFTIGAEKTTGTVLRHELEPGRKGYASLPVVRFQTANGQTVEFTNPQSGSFGAPSTGTEVTVLYDKAKPKEAVIDDPLAIWKLPIFGLMASLTTGIPFILLFLLEHRRKVETASSKVTV